MLINNTNANRLKYHTQEDDYNRATPQSLGQGGDTARDVLKETRDAVGVQDAIKRGKVMYTGET